MESSHAIEDFLFLLSSFPDFLRMLSFATPYSGILYSEAYRLRGKMRRKYTNIYVVHEIRSCDFKKNTLQVTQTAPYTYNFYRKRNSVTTAALSFIGTKCHQEISGVMKNEIQFISLVKL
jgi:hypothetical protein